MPLTIKLRKLLLDTFINNYENEYWDKLEILLLFMQENGKKANEH